MPVETARHPRPSWNGRGIGRFFGAPVKAVHAIAELAVLALVVIVLLSVGARYVGGSPILVASPFTSYLVLFIVFLGAPGALRRSQHVRIDLLTQALPSGWGKVMRLFGDAIGVALVAYLVYTTFRQFLSAVATGATDLTALRIPLAYTQWVLPLGLLLMLGVYVLQWWQTLARGLEAPVRPENTGAEDA